MKKFLTVLAFGLALVFVGCGNEAADSQVEGESSGMEVVPVESASDHVTIENVSYPLYPGAELKQKVATLHMYKVEADAEEVFAWYSDKMAEEGWTIALDGSNGRTGQRTFQLGDPNDRPGLKFVIIHVFQDGDETVLNITPQPNKYRD